MTWENYMNGLESLLMNWWQLLLVWNGSKTIKFLLGCDVSQ